MTFKELMDLVTVLKKTGYTGELERYTLFKIRR